MSKPCLSIQDISCYGQCSTTVALPILSALGLETAILPTAILSTHTGCFTGYTFCDLKGDIPGIIAHWQKEGIRFNGILTGYLGHAQDIDLVLKLHHECNDGPLFVDPAFGDFGKLYGGFDKKYVKAYRALIKEADFILPNLTEAAFLLDQPYNPHPSELEINAILGGLLRLGAKGIILKGIGNGANTTGFVYLEGNKRRGYVHALINKEYHGTGDVFASTFAGCMLRGLDPFTIASNFVYEAIKATLPDKKHDYGVKFEPLLGDLASAVKLKLGQ